MDMNIKRMGPRPFDMPDIFGLGLRSFDMFELDQRSFRIKSWLDHRSFRIDGPEVVLFYIRIGPEVVCTWI